MQSQKTCQKCKQNNFNTFSLNTNLYTKCTSLVTFQTSPQWTHSASEYNKSDQNKSYPGLKTGSLSASCPSDRRCSESSAESHQRWSSRPAKVSRTQMHSRTQTQYRAYTHTFVEQVYLCAHVSEQAWAGLTLSGQRHMTQSHEPPAAHACRCETRRAKRWTLVCI